MDRQIVTILPNKVYHSIMQVFPLCTTFSGLLNDANSDVKVVVAADAGVDGRVASGGK